MGLQFCVIIFYLCYFGWLHIFVRLISHPLCGWDRDVFLCCNLSYRHRMLGFRDSAPADTLSPHQWALGTLGFPAFFSLNDTTSQNNWAVPRDISSSGRSQYEARQGVSWGSPSQSSRRLTVSPDDLIRSTSLPRWAEWMSRGDRPPSRPGLLRVLPAMPPWLRAPPGPSSAVQLHGWVTWNILHSLRADTAKHKLWYLGHTEREHRSCKVYDYCH